MRRHDTRVLVVSSEPLCRWALRERFTEAGLCVLDASGELPPEDLEAVDVLVLDATLPRGGALNVLQRVRLRNPRCGVVLMTEFDDLSLTKSWPASASWRAIQKPFDVGEVLAAVKELARVAEERVHSQPLT